jgi:hypothetical protein
MDRAASGATVSLMQSNGEKVTVALDAEIVARARDTLGKRDESDAAVVERALNAYLLGRLLDATEAKSDLSDKDAQALAVDEVRMARRMGKTLTRELLPDADP